MVFRSLGFQGSLSPTEQSIYFVRWVYHNITFSLFDLILPGLLTSLYSGSGCVSLSASDSLSVSGTCITAISSCAVNVGWIKWTWSRQWFAPYFETKILLKPVFILIKYILLDSTIGNIYTHGFYILNYAQPAHVSGAMTKIW